MVPVIDPASIEFGLDTAATISADPGGGLRSAAQTIRDTIEEAVLADRIGIDSFNIGEHYRPEFTDSAGLVSLATIAGRTSRIRLGTAVTVLSSQDPVRVYTETATLNAASNGRAQLILGRASLTDSFPLFGYDLADYEVLFEEKLDLALKLFRHQPVTWTGTTRSPLVNQSLEPALESEVPLWIGVGGSPDSTVRAAKNGLPLIIAIIGGQPARFLPYYDLYHRTLKQYGHPGPGLTGFHAPGHIADTDEEAIAQHFRYQADLLQRVRPEWGQLTEVHYRRDVERGAFYVGSPETVAQKLATNIRLLGVQRVDLVYGIGRLPHEHRMQMIELYGTKVIPRVRELLAEPPAATRTGSSPTA